MADKERGPGISVRLRPTEGCPASTLAFLLLDFEEFRPGIEIGHTTVHRGAPNGDDLEWTSLFIPERPFIWAETPYDAEHAASQKEMAEAKLIVAAAEQRKYIGGKLVEMLRTAEARIAALEGADESTRQAQAAQAEATLRADKAEADLVAAVLEAQAAREDADRWERDWEAQRERADHLAEELREANARLAEGSPNDGIGPEDIAALEVEVRRVGALTDEVRKLRDANNEWTDVAIKADRKIGQLDDSLSKAEAQIGELKRERDGYRAELARQAKTARGRGPSVGDMLDEPNTPVQSPQPNERPEQPDVDAWQGPTVGDLLDAKVAEAEAQPDEPGPEPVPEPDPCQVTGCYLTGEHERHLRPGPDGPTLIEWGWTDEPDPAPTVVVDPEEPWSDEQIAEYTFKVDQAERTPDGEYRCPLPGCPVAMPREKIAGHWGTGHKKAAKAVIRRRNLERNQHEQMMEKAAELAAQPAGPSPAPQQARAAAEAVTAAIMPDPPAEEPEAAEPVVDYGQATQIPTMKERGYTDQEIANVAVGLPADADTSASKHGARYFSPPPEPELIIPAHPTRRPDVRQDGNKWVCECGEAFRKITTFTSHRQTAEGAHRLAVEPAPAADPVPPPVQDRRRQSLLVPTGAERRKTTEPAPIFPAAGEQIPSNH